MEKFCTILKFCERLQFLKLCNSSKDYIVGPNGAILQEILRNEWLQSNLINKDFMSVLNISNLVDSYNYVKAICLDRVPFSIVHMERDAETNYDLLGNGQLTNPGQQVLKNFVFVSPTDSSHLFHNLQQQRRIWWKKMSASPRRYALTDIQTNAGNSQVNIISNFDWGPQVLETITLNSNGHTSYSKDQLQVKCGRKTVQAHCISTSTSLTTMLLNTLFDAYDDSKFQGVPRPLLRFHKKISPYKISFSITTNSNNGDELTDLAHFASKKLRANNISVLLLPSASKNGLEAQYLQYDELGVPYTIILNDDSLKNGIVRLRNRDTTLKEQVHISDLPNYIQLLFKNY